MRWAQKRVITTHQPCKRKIDELNGWIYDTVNNGVYKAGFATSQQAYDEAVAKVFESLARLEQILGQHRYLTGNQLTEADIRLWTTLVRFDPVYVTHFKCVISTASAITLICMASCAISTRCRELPKQSISITSVIITSAAIRPSTLRGLFPIGPWQDLDEPHGRDVRFQLKRHLTRCL